MIRKRFPTGRTIWKRSPHEQEGRAPPRPEPMNLRRTVRGPITWLIVAVVVVLALLTFTSSSGGYKSTSLSTIEDEIASHHVASATLKDKEQQVQVTLDDKSKQQSSYTANYDTVLQQELKDNGVKTRKVSVTHENVLLQFLFSL